MDSRFERKFSVLASHPEISLRKEKIFIKANIQDRKTKIVCTLGYLIILNNFKINFLVLLLGQLMLS